MTTKMKCFVVLCFVAAVVSASDQTVWDHCPEGKLTSIYAHSSHLNFALSLHCHALSPLISVHHEALLPLSMRYLQPDDCLAKKNEHHDCVDCGSSLLVCNSPKFEMTGSAALLMVLSQPNRHDN